MNYRMLKREDLGFTRKCGHISLCEEQVDTSTVDWEEISRTWGRYATGGLNIINAPVALKTCLYISRGRLRQHTDVVEYDTVSVGLIADCAEDFELATPRNRIKAEPGDIFMLDPHTSHGAETTGDFTFLVMDVTVQAMKPASHYLEIFRRDIELIATNQQREAA